MRLSPQTHRACGHRPDAKAVAVAGASDEARTRGRQRPGRRLPVLTRIERGAADHTGHSSATGAPWAHPPQRRPAPPGSFQTRGRCRSSPSGQTAVTVPLLTRGEPPLRGRSTNADIQPPGQSLRHALRGRAGQPELGPPHAVRHWASSAKPLPSAANRTWWARPGSPVADGMRSSGTARSTPGANSPARSRSWPRSGGRDGSSAEQPVSSSAASDPITPAALVHLCMEFPLGRPVRGEPAHGTPCCL